MRHFFNTLSNLFYIPVFIFTLYTLSCNSPPRTLIAECKVDASIETSIDNILIGESGDIQAGLLPPNTEVLWFASEGTIKPDDKPISSYTAPKIGILDTITLEVSHQCGAKDIETISVLVIDPTQTAEASNQTATAAAATATHYANQTATATSVPTATATEDARPPTPAPIPLLPAPNLINAYYQTPNICLQYEWSEMLEERWFFAIRAGQSGSEPVSRDWTKNTTQICINVFENGFPEGDYDVYIIVIYDDDGDATGDNGGWHTLSEESNWKKVYVDLPDEDLDTP